MKITNNSGRLHHLFRGAPRFLAPGGSCVVPLADLGNPRTVKALLDLEAQGLFVIEDVTHEDAAAIRAAMGVLGAPPLAAPEVQAPEVPPPSTKPAKPWPPGQNRARVRPRASKDPTDQGVVSLSAVPGSVVSLDAQGDKD